MVRFADAAELHRSVGAILRLASEHPVVGLRLAAAETVLRIVVTDPDCELTVALDGTHRVVPGPDGPPCDVQLLISGDHLDGFWRGDYDIVRGLAAGEVLATGRVSRVLKILPAFRPFFPVYRAIGRSKQTHLRSAPLSSASTSGPAERTEIE
jgi:hypothetical protein